MNKRETLTTNLKKKEKTNWFKKTTNILINILLGFIVFTGIVVSAISLSAKNNGGIPSFFGTSPLIVLSDSMKGTFSEGDLIFVKKVTFDMQGQPNTEFKENETIVAFLFDIDIDGKPEIVTHLFIEKTSNGSYVFQGTYKGEDGTAELDKQVVSPADIVGVYNGVSIKGLGKALKFLQSTVGFAICILVPLFIYFLYAGIKLILVVFEDKTAKQLAATKSAMTDEELEKERERIREEVRRELLEEEKKKG